MPGQEHASRSAGTRCRCSRGAPGRPGRSAVKETGDDIDSVLDEIDGVLESNAEEFVRGFVQKGGQ